MAGLVFALSLTAGCPYTEFLEHVHQHHDHGGTGSGNAGSGNAGSGNAGSGAAGSGTAGSAGMAGSSEAGSGEAGSGTAGSAEAGSGEAGSGTAGSAEAGSGEAGSGTAGSGTPVVTFDDVYAIFTDAGCADCHGGASPPQGLNLETIDTAYANLVGVQARECATGHLRVEAGSSGTSYLINKLTGVDLCSGQRMPRGGPFLDDATIDVVRAWIDSGAAR